MRIRPQVRVGFVNETAQVCVHKAVAVCSEMQSIAKKLLLPAWLLLHEGPQVKHGQLQLLTKLQNSLCILLRELIGSFW